MTAVAHNGSPIFRIEIRFHTFSLINAFDLLFFEVFFKLDMYADNIN